ncbi:hypothetical protein V8G54_025528 [Vigna mungo]|uniref:Xyloglucan endotransglucosylase/hydrolase n=1 Tax=Vigna mungo TaxID=3915 RepID=A0AAQ3MYH6_VIGMU
MSKMLGLFVGFLFLGLAASVKFDELFQPSWSMDHFIHEGELLKLKLDNYSGAGFGSKSKYMFGKVAIQLKLVEGDSAGTMSSDGPTHNEFDFEFLGNTSGEPYSVQTNVYVNGVGNREQRLNLWFDPTKDFHTYSIFWNQRQVVVTVSPLGPINLEKQTHGKSQSRRNLITQIRSGWDADKGAYKSGTQGNSVPKGPTHGYDWATQGGRVKTDWSHAPFFVTYKDFQIDACECPVPVTSTASANKCNSSEDKKYWWDEPTLSELNLHQSHQLMWVRANHMVYDYCTDTARFPVTPAECVHHRHN